MDSFCYKKSQTNRLDTKRESIFLLHTKPHLNYKDRYYLRVKFWDKIFQSNGPKKQAGVAILISNEIDFQQKLVKRDEESNFIVITGKIHQDEVSILNI